MPKNLKSESPEILEFNEIGIDIYFPGFRSDFRAMGYLIPATSGILTFSVKNNIRLKSLLSMFKI